MKRSWLLFDGNFIAHRAYFTTGHLKHNGKWTGTLFGFLRTVLQLQNVLGTKRVCFCFDEGKSKREEILPTYKMNRKNRSFVSKDAKESYSEMRKQINLLRDEYLEGMGFKNVFSEEGYEADDLIASLCLSLPNKDDKWIVSADQDFFQCLSTKRNVRMWNPIFGIPITEEVFTRQWRIVPPHWTLVKAIAGCKSDNIIGLERVGEKTAASYIRGDCTDNVFKKIDAAQDQIERNKRLVLLPFPGTPECSIYTSIPDNKKQILKFMERFGMLSLQNLV